MKRNKTLVEKMAMTIIFITIISIVVGIVGYVVIGSFVLQNPDAIGRWLGELIDSINLNN